MEKGRNNIIETKELQIFQNTFIYDDAIIQIDNISKVSVAPIEKRAIPSWAIICAIIGFLIVKLRV